MKTILSFVVFSLIAMHCLAQKPQRPDPTAGLFLKNCRQIATNFKICTYCENKELTKNCKDFWCENGVCVDKPFKQTPPMGNQPGDLLLLALATDFKVSQSSITIIVPTSVKEFRKSKYYVEPNWIQYSML